MVSTTIVSNPTTKKKSTGRKKIEIKKIEKSNSLQVTFSKRRTGLFKKASELCILTGAHVAIFVNSPAGRMYVFGNPDVDSLIEKVHLQQKSNNDNVSLPLLPVNEFSPSYEELLKGFDAGINTRNEMIMSSGSNEDDGLGFDEFLKDSEVGNTQNEMILSSGSNDANDLGFNEEFSRDFSTGNMQNELIASGGSNENGLGFDECIDDGMGLEEFLREFDAGNTRNEMILSSGSNDDDGLGINEYIDGMGFEEFLKEFDAGNTWDKMIASTGSNADKGLGLDECCIDGMSLEELENYLSKLQQDKFDVEDRANMLMLNNFYHQG